MSNRVAKAEKPVQLPLSSMSEHWKPTSTWPKSGKHRSQLMQKIKAKKRQAQNKKSRLRKMLQNMPKL